jgi:hypothetical protein
MRNFLLFCLFGLTVALHLQASEISPRDTIFKKNGEIFRVRILRQVGDTVFYSPYGSQEEKFFLTAELSKLSYDSGQLVLFGSLAISKGFINPRSDEEDKFVQGQADANMYYRPKDWIGTGVILGLFSWFYLVPLLIAGIVSLVKPNLKNIPYQDTRLTGKRDNSGKTPDIQQIRQLFKNRAYREGYLKTAHGYKARRLWFGFLIGLASLIIIALILFLLAFRGVF